MKRAIDDKVIVPLVYEGRKVSLNEPKKTIDTYFESLTKELLPEQKKEFYLICLKLVVYATANAGIC